MISRHSRGRRRPVPALLVAAVLATGATAPTGAARAADTADAGKRVYVKANCVGCHKWHGDGGGGYGGAALSLRATELDREQIVEIVNCGRPGTGMPLHDRAAYAATSCYGMAKADLGQDAPPTPKAYLRAEEIQAVADYVVSTLKGKGTPTKEDCVAFWGPTSRECSTM